MSYSLNQLYQAAGLSKQAVHQQLIRQEAFEGRVKDLIVEVDVLRDAHPGCGLERMHNTLQPGFIGRDRFIELFTELGYKLKKKKNHHRTTYSSKEYYSNLIKGLVIDRPNFLWQSDITYYRVKDRFYYVVFIIDVYTKIIVGHRVSDHMRAKANLECFNMGVNRYGAPEIHHSDRGSQYNATEYVSRLNQFNTQISMGEKAQDNAYAERINKTIKEEFIDHWKPQTGDELKKMVRKAVNYYNKSRQHKHLKKMTPLNFLDHWKTLPVDQRPKMTIFNDESLT